MNIIIAVWFLAFVAGGFSEDFPNRPTAAGMDTNVALGMDCVRGVNERCWATQYSTNPVQYHVEPVTNTAELNLDKSQMGQMASRIKSLVPRYADPDTIYDGTPNVAMLTVAGVWEEMAIGDEAGQFTETPAIGENPATYGDYPWRIYNVNLDERNSACKSLNQSSQAVSHVVSVYTGHGVGNTYQDAYNAAAADYKFITNTPASSIRQHCKIACWSNLVYQGGSGIMTEGGTPEQGNEVDHEWFEDTYRTVLNITAAYPSEASPVTVSCSGVSPTYHTYTNIVVSGSTDPDMTGTYYDHVGMGNPGLQWYKTGTDDNVFLSGGVGVLYVWAWMSVGWTNPAGIEGYYGSANTNIAFGSPHAQFDIVYEEVASPVDYSGNYYPISNATYGICYQGSAGYIFPAGGNYIIYSSLTLDPTNAYLIHNALLGEYTAVNMHVDSAAASSAGELSPACCGQYEGEDPTWGQGGWTCGADGGRYISSLSPHGTEWTKTGDETEGIYVGSGTNYGDVRATFASVIDVPAHWGPWYPVYHTHSTTNIAGQEGETNTVFYECWLRKEAPTQTFSISSTNVEHRGIFLTRPIKPAYGTDNVFNDEDLGLSEDVLNAAGDWTAWTYASPAIIENYWTSSLSTPPDITSEPEEPNSSVCSGFEASEWLGILDWDFQYCLDE